MTDQINEKVLVESTDSKASILAALARIEDVPASATLIDSISDNEWCAEHIADWKIEVGSASFDASDEADDSDAAVTKVA